MRPVQSDPAIALSMLSGLMEARPVPPCAAAELAAA